MGDNPEQKFEWALKNGDMDQVKSIVGKVINYLPTVILIVIFIIIGIPSPTHSFSLGLNPSFSANPPYRSLSFFSFRIH